MLTRDELDAIRGHIMGVNVRVLAGPNANAGDTIAPWVTVCGSAAVDEIFAQAALAADLAASEAEMREAANGCGLRLSHTWCPCPVLSLPSPRAALALAEGKGEKHDA